MIKNVQKVFFWTYKPLYNCNFIYEFSNFTVH